MHSALRLVALALLAAACGNAPLATTLLRAPARCRPRTRSAALREAAQGDSVHAELDRRRTSSGSPPRKIDDETRRPDVQFRRVIDRIDVEVEPGTGGTAMTSIKVTAAHLRASTPRSADRPRSRRSASETASQADAQTLIDKCSSSRWIPVSCRASFRPIHSGTIRDSGECEQWRFRWSN